MTIMTSSCPYSKYVVHVHVHAGIGMYAQPIVLDILLIFTKENQREGLLIVITVTCSSHDYHMTVV